MILEISHTTHIPSPLHPLPSLVRQQPAMEAAATIIDLRRASARERMARSRAKRKEAKRAAEKIRELEATATIIELGWTAGGNGGATILEDAWAAAGAGGGGWTACDPPIGLAF